MKSKTIDKNDGTQGAIVTLTLRIASGEHDGKSMYQDCWYDDDGQNTTVMKWALAALGIKPGTEDADAQFRVQYPDLDLGFDEATLTPNSGWNEVLNSLVECTVAKKFNGKRGTFENRFSGMRPIGS